MKGIGIVIDIFLEKELELDLELIIYLEKELELELELSFSFEKELELELELIKRNLSHICMCYQQIGSHSQGSHL